MRVRRIGLLLLLVAGVVCGGCSHDSARHALPASLQEIPWQRARFGDGGVVALAFVTGVESIPHAARVRARGRVAEITLYAPQTRGFALNAGAITCVRVTAWLLRNHPRLSDGARAVTLSLGRGQRARLPSAADATRVIDLGRARCRRIPVLAQSTEAR